HTHGCRIEPLARRPPDSRRGHCHFDRRGRGCLRLSVVRTHQPRKLASAVRVSSVVSTSAGAVVDRDWAADLGTSRALLCDGHGGLRFAAWPGQGHDDEHGDQYEACGRGEVRTQPGWLFKRGLRTFPAPTTGSGLESAGRRSRRLRDDHATLHGYDGFECLYATGH